MHVGHKHFFLSHNAERTKAVEENMRETDMGMGRGGNLAYSQARSWSPPLSLPLESSGDVRTLKFSPHSVSRGVERRDAKRRHSPNSVGTSSTTAMPDTNNAERSLYILRPDTMSACEKSGGATNELFQSMTGGTKYSLACRVTSMSWSSSASNVLRLNEHACPSEKWTRIEACSPSSSTWATVRFSTCFWQGVGVGERLSVRVLIKKKKKRCFLPPREGCSEAAWQRQRKKIPDKKEDTMRYDTKRYDTIRYDTIRYDNATRTTPKLFTAKR